MPDPFVGEIRMFSGTFAPTGWALCDGQLLPISQNTALFSLLGTAFGGDGRTTFALPDLRGRVPVCAGQGVGLSERTRGQSGGEETHVLTTAEMPAHSHSYAASSANGSKETPSSLLPARNPAAIPQYANSASTLMADAAAGPAGADQPHNNMQPSLTVTFMIALQGIFPSQP